MGKEKIDRLQNFNGETFQKEFTWSAQERGT
jgi:hypothetical protein